MSGNIKEEIKKLVCENSKASLEVEKITEDMNLQKDLQYDSITIIELISKIEEKFGLDFNYADIDVDKISQYKGLEELVISYIDKN